GEDASADDIGGSGMHTRTSGVAHLEVETELDALQSARHLLSYVPTNVDSPLPVADPVPVNPRSAEALGSVVPEKASVVFDMHAVIDGVLDNGARLELMPEHAGSAVTLFGRIEGRPVGVVANQPAVRGGI